MGGDDFGFEKFINKNFPEEVNASTAASEVEAVRALQKKLRYAGFNCADETVRRIVQHAEEQQKRR
jgi:hypothetical protein